MTCSSTCCIFACLFLNHSDDKSDNSFQQLIENWTRSGQRKIRIPYQLQSIEKAILSSAYLKNYFGSYSNQKHATPTSDSNSTTLDYTEATYVKSRVSSHLVSVSVPKSLVSFGNHRVSTPTLALFLFLFCEFVTLSRKKLETRLYCLCL